MQLGTGSLPSVGTDNVTRITITPNGADEGDGFFGAGGPSWHDIVDTINPLEHIPFVSSLFDAATGHKPSTASKLAGGALLGGPAGFVASLASVIFESATGKSPEAAVVAALSGDDSDSTTQVADAGMAATQTASVATEAAAPTSTADAAPTNNATNSAAPVDRIAVADVTPASTAAKEQAVLSLYGASAASAHRSYQNAQMRPYLKDVSTSQVL